MKKIQNSHQKEPQNEIGHRDEGFTTSTDQIFNETVVWPLPSPPAFAVVQAQ